MNFTHNLSDTEYLMFKTFHDKFELYSGYEGGGEQIKIATFQSGKWIWSGFEQHKMFWSLYKSFTEEFGRAIKIYNRSLKEKPKTYIVTCAKRRFDIKITKMKRSMWDWVYGTFYGK